MPGLGSDRFRVEDMHGNFGRTIEPDGDSGASGASGSVAGKLPVSPGTGDHSKRAFAVADDNPTTREANLATMRMST